MRASTRAPAGLTYRESRWRPYMNILSRIWTSFHNSLRRYPPFKKTSPSVHEVYSATDRTYSVRL